VLVGRTLVLPLCPEAGQKADGCAHQFLAACRFGYNELKEPRVKPIRFTQHARLQCAERGATEEEVVQAIREGVAEPARQGRVLYRFNFTFHRTWQGNWHAIKQVAPVVKEETDEIVVVTVYTFYF